MMEILRKVHQKDREAFVAACYRELLVREPDPEGLASHMRMLGKRPKAAVMAAIMQSPEAEQLYRSGPVSLSGKKRPAAADIMRKLYSYSDERFVQELYEELLCRRADRSGFSQNVHQLRRGAPRSAIAAGLLSSGEAAELLKAKSAIPIAQKILFDYANRRFYPDYNY
jgi:hypothetical protein